ncbi:MAG: HEAT repeat domain-containing protein [Planctomycetes bacterium]|nr:HEAT repeat domain-containing protein [Planctomycetota bacterium]
MGEIGDRAATAALLTAVRDEDVRRWATSALQDIGPGALPQVLELLRHQDPKLRCRAAEILGEWGPSAKSAVSHLVRALNEYEVCPMAAYALGRIGADARSAIPALSRKMLTGRYLHECEAAAKALGKIGGPDVVPHLLRGLKDRRKFTYFPKSDTEGFESRVPWYAADALARIEPLPKSTLPFLIAALKHDKQNSGAMQAIARFGKEAKDAVPLLVEAIPFNNKELRYYFAADAIEALGNIGPEVKSEAMALLIETMGHDILGNRAMRSLGNMGSGAQDAVPALVEATGGGKLTRRLTAVHTLGKIAKYDEAALDALIVLSKDEDQQIQIEAFWALANNEPELETARRKTEAALIDAISLAVRCLRDEHGFARAKAANIVRALGPKASGTVAALIEALEEGGNSYVRTAVIKALGEMEPEGKSAIPTLLAVVREDDDIDLRRLAIEAIQKMDSDTSGLVLQALIESLQSSRASHRAAAAQLLGSLQSPEDRIVQALIDSLADRRLVVRSCAAESLGQIGPEAKAATLALQSVLKDEYQAVADKASQALARINSKQNSTNRR